eukprot:2441323-Amphidinium_carterae.1
MHALLKDGHQPDDTCNGARTSCPLKARTRAGPPLHHLMWQSTHYAAHQLIRAIMQDDEEKYLKIFHP